MPSTHLLGVLDAGEAGEALEAMDSFVGWGLGLGFVGAAVLICVSVFQSVAEHPLATIMSFFFWALLTHFLSAINPRYHHATATQPQR